MNRLSHFSVRVCLLAAFSLLASFRPLSAAPTEWEPEKTWIFAVGVLQFDDSSLATWPDKGRVDAQFLAACEKRGVPADQVLFLKNQEATKAHITSELTKFLRRPGPDDTLIFYYAGHGGRDFDTPARTVSFVTYDTKSTWTTGELLKAIESNFKGSLVLLTADCCHSGGLVDEVRRHPGRTPIGVLTSACAAATSTGNWTFTQCLVDLVSGSPFLDLDSNGQITFAEAAKYAEQEMAFLEGQRSDEGSFAGFDSGFVFGPAQAHLAPRVGERLEGLDRGDWFKAKIIAAKDGKFQVTWPGWDHTYDAWLTPDKLRPYRPVLLPAGTPVTINWESKWYPGNVVKTDLGLLLVHYDGFPAGDDEWVTRDRVKPKK